MRDKGRYMTYVIDIMYKNLTLQTNDIREKR